MGRIDPAVDDRPCKSRCADLENVLGSIALDRSAGFEQRYGGLAVEAGLPDFVARVALDDGIETAPEPEKGFDDLADFPERVDVGLQQASGILRIGKCTPASNKAGKHDETEILPLLARVEYRFEIDAFVPEAREPLFNSIKITIFGRQGAPPAGHWNQDADQFLESQLGHDRGPVVSDQSSF